MNQQIRLRNWPFWSLLLVSTLFFLSLVPTLALGIYDEGLAVYGAQRVLDGEVPYRDFWTLYSPGQFYALAWIFQVFGPSILAERIYSALVQVSIVMVAYSLAAKLVAGKWALLPGFLVTLSLPALTYSYPVAPALLLALLSCRWLAAFFEGKTRVYLVLAGMGTGLVTVFRHDLGVYAFAAETAALAAFAVTRNPTSNAPPSGRWLPTLATLSIFGAGLAVVLAPVAILLLRHVSRTDLYADLIQFPLTVYPAVRSLPFPEIVPDFGFLLGDPRSLAEYLIDWRLWVWFYFPLGVFFLTSLVLAGKVVRGQTWESRDWLVLLLVLLGLAFFNHSRIRADPPHLVATIVPAVILFGWALVGWLKTHSLNLWLDVVLLGGPTLLLAFFLSGSFLLWFLLNPRPISEAAALALPRARGILAVREHEDALEEAIAYLQGQTAPTERIFVGNLRHDQLCLNDIMFYFLCERHCATRYHELHPGLANTLAVQREMIDDLKRQRVRFVVLARTERMEPNRSSRSSGITELDVYIHQHYRLMRRFGPYLVFQGKATE